MSGSILTDTKKVLGLEEDYEVFDVDILMHINSAFSTLTQLNVGPADGLTIEDKDATWDTFLGDDPRLNAAKTYVYLRVRLLFDPPSTQYLVQALQEQVKELEWRLNVTVDTNPLNPSLEKLLEEVKVGNITYDPITGDMWSNV